MVFKALSRLFMGAPERQYQASTLMPQQQPLFNQLQGALQQQGQGGAFGDTSDYYRGLLSDQGFNDFAAPEMRRFNEQIVPGLAEQFAGMGSGALSSSGFRNAALGAGADLSERLASIRGNLRMQGAQGLSQLGQFGLGQFAENIVRPASPGLLQGVAQGAGQAFGKAAGNKLFG